MPKRPDTATRARRLLALIPMLKKGETIALSELAAAVGCEPAQLVADLSTLTMCGVPPFTPYDMIDLVIEGDTVTVHAEAPGIDRPLRLTLSEARALGAALDAAGYEPDSPLRERLRGAASSGISLDELEHTVRASTGPGGLAETYSILAGAAEAHEKVRIHYFTGSTGNISERTVQPWALVNRLGAWYLIALCEAVHEERVFRLDRIFDARPLGERFEPPSLVPFEVTPATASLPMATVRFAAGVTLPDEQSWPGATFAQGPDGTALVSVPYQTEAWVARRVMSYLGDAEVVEPPGLRTAVRQAALDALESIV
ncbi:MAG: WYL domain-containing protein [Coriobacteriia bacterium]|nr:WYL domain-containing protein [Coriobacteriia bacterium]